MEQKSNYTDDITESKVYDLLACMCPPSGYLILPWDKVSEILKSVFCANGGDEDWMVVTAEDYTWASWLDRIDTCLDPDIYKVRDITVYIGSHA